jgi:hypothetical protein
MSNGEWSRVILWSSGFLWGSGLLGNQHESPSLPSQEGVPYEITLMQSITLYYYPNTVHSFSALYSNECLHVCIYCSFPIQHSPLAYLQ